MPILDTVTSRLQTWRDRRSPDAATSGTGTAQDTDQDRPDPPHVVVVGAGFGGLTLARELVDAVRDGILRVTLVDRQNHHTFQPLLYQVATAGLPPQDIGHPLRPIFGPGRWRDRTCVTVRLGEVVAVDRGDRTLTFADGGTLSWDRLVVATGAVTADFDLPGVAELGFGLKSIADALALRDHVLRQFELADNDPRRLDDGTLTFVVAGGGPTGVEVSGALAELVDHVMRRDHPDLDLGHVRIVLLEMLDRLLVAFHPESSERARVELEDKGVEVRLGRAIQRAEADAVVLDDDTTIPSRTLVWVAGVRPSPLGAALGAELEKGRVVVDDHLRLPDDPTVAVVGDLAAFHDPDHDPDDPLPQLAPVAMQQARHVADVLLADARGEPLPDPFEYLDKGTMATIGRNHAVAELPGGIRIGGFPAWISWLGLHLAFLVGFRNRTSVAVSWAYNYLTYDRASRLMLHADDRGLHRELLGAHDPARSAMDAAEDHHGPPGEHEPQEPPEDRAEDRAADRAADRAGGRAADGAGGAAEDG